MAWFTNKIVISEFWYFKHLTPRLSQTLRLLTPWSHAEVWNRYDKGDRSNPIQIPKEFSKLPDSDFNRLLAIHRWSEEISFPFSFSVFSFFSYLLVRTGLQGRILRSAGMSRRALVYGRRDRSETRWERTPVSRSRRRAWNWCIYPRRMLRNSMTIRNKRTCSWASKTSRPASGGVWPSYVELARSASSGPTSSARFSGKDYTCFESHTWTLHRFASRNRDGTKRYSHLNTKRTELER